jgi:hypothetical protein
MALQTSGPISLNDLHVEAGGSSGTTCTLNDADIRDIIGKASGATNSLFEYYGQSSEELLTSGGTINGQAQRQEITASTYISSGGTLRIPSTMWVWSDSRTTAALTIDIPCTIINDGKIIGKGGQGGSGLALKNTAHPTTSTYRSGYSTGTLGTGSDGGPAIKINSGVSNVTIINSSGAYIAGGGGGGGSSHVEPNNTGSGGGAGAGGAEGGFPYGPIWENANKGTGWPGYTTNGSQYSDFGIYGTNNGNGPSIGFGGKLNESGWYVSVSNSPNWGVWSRAYTYGGEAGGPGAASAGEDSGSPGGGGSGRILPGVRTNSQNYGSNVTSSYGGAGGEAGGNGNSVGGHSGSSGGGGGWGSAGGRGYRGAFTSVQCQGGDAGKAVDDSGVSYTLSNSGTIYGGT